MLRSLFVTIVACGVGVGSAVASAEANPTAKVEFVEVKGVPCLQPRVVSAEAVLADFRLAEQRWLSERYPGRRVPRWQNVLALPPETKAAAEKSDATVITETAFVQAADGSEISVCFQIALESTKGRRHE